MDTNTLIPGEKPSRFSEIVESASEAPEAHEEYARVEIMGHRVRLGRVEEVERFGAKFVRIHFRNEDNEEVVEDYAGASIFSVAQVPKIEVEIHEARQQKNHEDHLKYLDSIRNKQLTASSQGQSSGLNQYEYKPIYASDPFDNSSLPLYGQEDE